MNVTPAAEPESVLGVEHTRPNFAVPPGACDCHVHVFGPYDRFPLSPDRLYMPGPAHLEDLLAHQRALGLDRVVIVQPSAYGTDNTCMIDALERLGSKARGVAVIDASDSKDTMRTLHEVGVRGIRINLETAGVSDPVAARRHLEATATQVEPLGWHVQIYADLKVVAALHHLIRDLPITVVFDHFARASAAKGPDQPGFGALLSLLRMGKAYVKLSAPRRISNRPDHGDVAEIVKILMKANPERLLWGSDWPHPGARPGVARDPNRIEPFHSDDDGLALNRLNAWTGSTDLTKQILVENPAHLYGF